MEIELEAILIPLTFFFLVGFVIRQVRLRAEHETQRRFELGVRTLDRFNDPETLEKFLASAAGQEFLRLLDRGEPPLQRRLLRSVQGGIALSALGLAFMVLAGVLEGNVEMIIPGILLLSLGGALLLGALVAYRLAQRWEIIGDRGRGRGMSPYRDLAVQ
jgi:hypothetical protein